MKERKVKCNLMIITVDIILLIVYWTMGNQACCDVHDTDYKEMPEYAGRQTLTLVGTKESETNMGVKNKDIYDFNQSFIGASIGSVCSRRR